MERTTIQLVRKSQAVIEFATVSPLPVPLTATDGFAAHVEMLRAGIAAITQYEVLRTQLNRIRQVARVIDRVAPGVRQLVPRCSAPRREEALLTAARTTVDQITPIRTEFISRGMAPDFLDRVTQLVGVTEATATVRTAARRRRMVAREGIRQTLQTMRDALQCLDVIVRAQCEGDVIHGPTTLASWERALDTLWAPHRIPEVTPTMQEATPDVSGGVKAA